VNITRATAAGTALLAMLAVTPVSAEEQSLQQAIAQTKPIIDLRLRYENVQQDGFAHEADAVTLRGRLGFQTGKAWNTQLLAEADLMWPWVSDYNSTTNGKKQYPVVADPENYSVNRLQLTNTSIPDTTTVLGRQRINLDDQRFVGSVGWRQNEQTFNALRVTNGSLHDLTVDLTFFNKVNRIYGKDSPVGSYQGSSYLANVSYQTTPGKLTAFAYILDLDQAPTDSSRTYGLRFAGNHAWQGISWGYSASYATQSEYANSPLNYSDDYKELELSATRSGFSLTAGIELLAGNGTKGFTTPLATLHKFQGWADKFLVTPANGVDDRYLSLGYTHKRAGPFDTLSLAAVGHQFRSERLSIDYGSEIDLQAQVTYQHYAVMLKYADYNADAFATDTRKFWVQLEYIR
jgi:hypothetical protein